MLNSLRNLRPLIGRRIQPDNGDAQRVLCKGWRREGANASGSTKLRMRSSQITLDPLAAREEEIHVLHDVRELPDR